MIQGQITWFEIPVENLDRAILFYSEVLAIKIEKNKFLAQEYGIFNKDTGDTVKGALVKKTDYHPGAGIILFFYVIDLLESLKKVERFGGKVLVEKTLLKQQTAEGFLSIKQNLIDGNIGYIAEFLDCEGNRICLYSNS
jgi:predicted enzyme related to lactoylglutathione lyase